MHKLIEMKFGIAAWQKDKTASGRRRLISKGREKVELCPLPQPAIKQMLIGKAEGRITGNGDMAVRWRHGFSITGFRQWCCCRKQRRDIDMCSDGFSRHFKQGVQIRQITRLNQPEMT